MLKNRERMKRLIACGIAASIVSVNGLSVLASELNKSDKVNLALNKKLWPLQEKLMTNGVQN